MFHITAANKEPNASMRQRTARQYAVPRRPVIDCKMSDLDRLAQTKRRCCNRPNCGHCRSLQYNKTNAPQCRSATPVYDINSYPCSWLLQTTNWTLTHAI